MAYAVPKLTGFSANALDSAVREFLSALDQESAAVGSENDWKAFRDRWMARKNGILTQVNNLWLKAGPDETKREVGERVNELKARTTETVERIKPKRSVYAGARGGRIDGTAKPEGVSLKSQVGIPYDIPLPGIRRPIGAEHPVIKTMNEIVGVFRNLGYSVEEGP